MWVRAVVRCMMYLLSDDPEVFTTRVLRCRSHYSLHEALCSGLSCGRSGFGVQQSPPEYSHIGDRGAGHDVQVMQQYNDQSECWCYRARLSIVTMSTVDVVAGEDGHTC